MQGRGRWTCCAAWPSATLSARLAAWGGRGARGGPSSSRGFHRTRSRWWRRRRRRSPSEAGVQLAVADDEGFRLLAFSVGQGGQGGMSVAGIVGAAVGAGAKSSGGGGGGTRAEEWVVLHELPFTPDRCGFLVMRCMAVVARRIGAAAAGGPAGGEARLILKGADDAVLRACSRLPTFAGTVGGGSALER
ncbi:hypothetical protein T492DRAFT_843415 [Pavlovales sp. CCMP2436]|nr:hypothetical protein T492DRAFT_843415 [Pavlovales sp. CCMP2436]